MVKTMQCGPLTRSFDVIRASVNESDDRTIEVEFSSEEPVSRWFGVEVLDHSPGSVRMGRLNNGAPFLLDHRSYDSDAQIGVIESASVENGRGKATVRFSKSARAQEILDDIRDGIRRKISVGYSIHRFDVKKSERKDEPDTYRATDWEPFEVSLVPVPADDSVGVRSEDLFLARSASLTTNATLIMDPETKPEDSGERAQAEPETKPQTRAAEPSPVAPQIDPEAIRRAAAEEADRRDEIRAIASAHGIEDKEVKRAISENLHPDAFRAFVLRELEARHKPMNIQTQENPDKLPKGSRAYMLDTFARSAANALSARGVEAQIPDYSRFQADTEVGAIKTQKRALTSSPTLIDVAALDAGIGYSIIDETTAHSPEVANFPVDVISGATVEISVRDSLPTVGFRSANEGRTPKKTEHTSRIFQTQVIEEPIIVDIQGVLNSSRDPGRVLAAQAAGVTAATVEHIGVATWYAGSGYSGFADTKAPPGVLAQSETGTDHVVDATGSTALTSVWIVELGTDGLHHIYGNDTTLNIGANWTEESIADGSGYLRALVNYLSGRVATVLSNRNKAIRIKKIGTDTNKGLTDTLLAQAVERAMNLAIMPSAIFMNPRSLQQLRTSRTAYHPAGAPVPFPTEYEGIPIITTRNIKNDEGASI